MITRLYVDNFRSLVNFEIRFDETNLLLGGNGSGKSTVFEVLRKLRGFVLGEERFLKDTFPVSELTKWQKRLGQAFELDIKDGSDTFLYRLEIVHAEDRTKSQIKAESLKLANGISLFFSSNGKAHLFNDEGNESAVIEFDRTQSGVGFVQPRHDNRKLARFKELLAYVFVVKPTPVLMTSDSLEEVLMPSYLMGDFASWYRWLTQEDIGAVTEILRELEQVIPGLKALNSARAGERRSLKAEIQSEGIKNSYSFGQLSDGQKMLIAIYTLLVGTKNMGVSLFIDEPDNHVSLEEIQPWLRLFVDDCGSGEQWEQVVLISHHPEIIDYYPLGCPYWFARDAEAATRVKLFENIASDNADHRVLHLSETIAAGLAK